MSKLLLIAALAAMIAAPAWGQSTYDGSAYYDVTAAEEAPECVLFIKYTQPEAVPGAQFSFEEANSGEWCGRAVLHWLDDTGRAKISLGAYTQEETVNARCGAQLILNHATEATPIKDILAAEFEKACNGQATM